MSNSTRLPKFSFKSGIVLKKDNLKKDILKSIKNNTKIESNQTKKSKLINQLKNQTRNSSKEKVEVKPIFTLNQINNTKKIQTKKQLHNKFLCLNNINSILEPFDKKIISHHNQTINEVLNTSSTTSNDKYCTIKNRINSKESKSVNKHSNIHISLDKSPDRTNKDILYKVKESFKLLKKFEEDENKKYKKYSLFNFTNYKDNKNTKPNAQIPSEYFNDILSTFCVEENELEFKIIPNFMKNQPDINMKMRAIIVNWIIEVHNRFKLLPDTLFLSIIIFDRYMSTVNKIPKEKLQLIGVTSLLLACKYEEIFSPEIRDFVCILDKSYEKDDLMRMENLMMKILKFEVTFPSSLKYFEILRILFNIEDSWFDIGMFLLELSLLDCRFSKYSQAIIASSICYMILRFKECSLLNFFDVVSIEKDLIFQCIIDICFLIEYIDQSDYKAVVKKHSESYKKLRKIFDNNKLLN